MTTTTPPLYTPRARLLVVVEALLVGLPFCVFKSATGVYGVGVVGPVAYGLVALGVVDGVLNAVNIAAVALLGRRLVPVCALQAVTSRMRPGSGDLGAALDTALSFSLVAIVVGTGAVTRLSPSWAPLWNLAVVANVLGAGALRLAQALGAPQPPTLSSSSSSPPSSSSA